MVNSGSSANLLMVHPDPPVLAAEILAADADILAFQEYSPRWEAEFGLDGLMERYPHRVDIVRSDSFGTAIWSRVPLLTASLFELTGLPQSRATVQIGAGAVEILNRGIADDDRQALEDAYEARLLNPYIAADRGFIDAVIDPADTRTEIAAALEALDHKRERLQPRSHDNTPL